MSLLLANVITADMGLLPGLAFVGPALGLPLSVLAAVVERPFYSRGGVGGQKAIWYSLQANLISLVVGFVLLLVFGLLASAVGLGASDATFFLVWPIVAIGLSSVIERAHLVRRSGEPDISWPWVIAGNVVSAAACFTLLFPIQWVREHHAHWANMLRPHAPALQVGAGIASLIVFGFAFHAGRRQPAPAHTSVA